MWKQPNCVIAYILGCTIAVILLLQLNQFGFNVRENCLIQLSFPFVQNISFYILCIVIVNAVCNYVIHSPRYDCMYWKY